MISIVVAWIGASSSIGTQPPWTGNALPPGARDFRQGVEYTTLHANNSGAQDGFFDCMDAQGYEVTLVERGQPSVPASYLQTTHLPNAISDVLNYGLAEPVALVVIGGGNDAKSAQNASAYTDRMFGPWNTSGPGSPDTSVVGLARDAWGPDLPVILPTLISHNGGDLLAGLSENGGWYWHERVRANQLYGCDHDSFCRPVLTTMSEVPLDPSDDHPTAEGYYNLGWMICQRLIEDVLL